MRSLLSFFIAPLAMSTGLYAAEAGMPQLDPTFWASQAFWLILVFTILYIAISKFYLPKIKDNFKQIFSPQTAYQITSILEGATKRGTAKKLRDLNLDIAGKTGTTNKNTDTWFIGFTSDLVVGVYIGYDEPQTLGKFETGAKTAMPIFKSFMKKAVKKENTRPFKIPENITLMVVDSQTGKKVSFASKKTLIESFKSEKINQNFDVNLKNNNRFNNNNILRFY